MCEYCVDDLKMAEQWTLVAEIERQVILAEAEGGLSIPGAIRTLTDNELLAGIRFADIESLQFMAGQQSEGILDVLRHTLTNEIVNRIGADVADANATALRLMEFLRKPTTVVTNAIANAGRDIEKVLGDVYAGAKDIVKAEVEFQNKRPADFDTLKPPEAILAVQAQAAAGQPWAKLTDKVQKNHLNPSAIINGNLSKDAVRATLDAVPLAGAVDAARQAIHTAHGAGRNDAGDMQGASDIWASELLDGKTCEPCAKIDLTHYKSMAAAKVDYPMGGYRACLGEARCRGTLVFLYLEPGNTGVDPDGNVTGQISIGPNPPKDGLGLPPAVDTPPPAPKGDLQQRIRESIDALNVDAHLERKSFRDTVTGMSIKHSENAAAQEAVRKLHEDFAQLVVMPPGYTMKVDNAFGLDGQAQVDYVFYDQKGKYAGQANRVYFEEDGKFVVEHHAFVLEPDAQGHGIATRFNAASEVLYNKLGVNEIQLQANIDVGGYAWAKAGFDFKNEAAMNDLKMKIMSNEVIRPWPAEDKTRLLDLVIQMDHAHWKAGSAPTPYDIAMFGYTEGAVMWPGKQLLLNLSWEGKKVIQAVVEKPLKVRIAEAVAGLDIETPLNGKSFQNTIANMSWRSQDNAADMAAVRSLHEGFAKAVPLPPGFRMELDHVTSNDNATARVEYNFFDTNNRPVGMARRDYYLKDGEFKVEHALFKLDDNAQGHGISSRFLAASEAFYKRLGIKEITIHANIDVGGYAWAKAGFDWKDGYVLADMRTYVLADYRIENYAARGNFGKDQIEAMKKLRDTLTIESLKSGKAAAPYDIAMVGYTEGAENWLGKAILLGSDWLGKKRIT